MHDRVKGLIAINIAAVIFGSAALYGKMDVSPVWIVAMRGMFASGTLLSVGVVRKNIVLPSGATRLPLVITGIILSLHWLTFFYSVQLAGVAIATLTFAAFPLFTIILEAVARKKRLQPLAVTAGTLIVVAVLLLVRIDTHAPDILWGTILGLFSALLFAIFGIVSKTLTFQLSTITVSFCQNLVVFITLLPFLHFTCACARPKNGVDLPGHARHYYHCGYAPTLPICPKAVNSKHMQRFRGTGARICNFICRCILCGACYLDHIN